MRPPQELPSKLVRLRDYLQESDCLSSRDQRQYLSTLRSILEQIYQEASQGSGSSLLQALEEQKHSGPRQLRQQARKENVPHVQRSPDS